MKSARTLAVVACGLALSLYSTGALAQLTNQGMLDQVVMAFATRAAGWQTVVMNAAMWLFWMLGTISLVWTGGMMVLRKADIGEFFAEFIRFILFFGFFLWLLRNGPAFASSIIQSLQRIGEQASGVSSITPSGIADVGFMIWKQAITNLSAWQPIDSFVGVVLSAVILVLLAAIAVNMLLTLVSAWILMYAGIFFLGFGGSRWTSGIAINYYKTVLGVAVQLMAMVLLVGIGNDLLSTFYGKMSKGVLNFEELGVMLVFCMALLLLVAKVPPMLASVMTGGGIGSGASNIGAGAVFGGAIGVTGTATAAASMAGAAVSGGATGIAGGVQALMAAYSKASAASSGGIGGHGMGDMMGGVARAAANLGGSSSGGGSVFASMDSASSSGSGFTGSGSGSGGGFGSSATDSANSSGVGNTQANKDKYSSESGTAPDAEGKAAGSDAKRSRDGHGLAPGEQRSSGSLLGRATSIAAGTAGNLALGTWDVAKTKGASMRESALDRIGETTGGKIAAAIRARDAQAPASGSAAQAEMAFNNNELSAGKDQEEPSGASEVADFVNRNSKTS